jgi:hypothetical protein
MSLSPSEKRSLLSRMSSLEQEMGDLSAKIDVLTSQLEERSMSKEPEIIIDPGVASKSKKKSKTE